MLKLQLSSIWRLRAHPICAPFKLKTDFVAAQARHARGVHQAVKPNPGSAPSASNTPVFGTFPRHHINPIMPSTIDETTETFGNFNLLKRVKLDYTDVVVSKWQSRVTGLSIVHLDFEGELDLSSILSL